MDASKPERNGEARSPEELFADRGDDIRWLRRTDPVFDEICRDFEVIARILLEERHGDKAAEESLAGLSDEVRRRLYRHTGHD